MSDNLEFDPLLNDLTDGTHVEASPLASPAPVRATRDLSQMMRRIPVTLTLEVGSAQISLQDLMDIGPDSVVELDSLAGTPLVLKVNGTPIGRAEVVVSGENHGLRVVELDDVDLGALKA
ncbi:MAG TPA: FliM/FliN family flagellar motor switch protein [Aquabacterium sp.]|nr:FliM/FliN family flagellar motor switch protein [Aquabacterium sp.]